MPSVSYPPDAAEILAADDGRDPERWLVALCWTVIVFSLLQVLLFGFGRDQAAHAVVGNLLLEGGMPYRDALEPSPPGIFFLHAGIQLLLGKSMLGLRLVEVVGLLTLVGCFRWLGGALFGSRVAGLCGAAIAVLVHAQLEFWHTAQPESFAGFLLAGALVATIYSRPRVHLQAGLVGLLLGSALLFKPGVAAAGVVCAVHLARRIQVTRGGPAVLIPALAWGLGVAIPVGSCALWFFLRGGWSDLWRTLSEFTLLQAEPGWLGRTAPELFYAASVEALVGFSALLAVGMLAVLLLPPLYAREREGLFLVLGILSVLLATVAVEGVPTPHHHGAALLLLGFLAGAGWYKLWRRLTTSGAAGIVAFMTFLVVIGSMREATRDLPHGFWQRSAMRTGYLLHWGPIASREELDRQLASQGDYELHSIRRVAQELTHQLSPQDSLHVGNDEPLVYWLSAARPATRFLRGAPPSASTTSWADELRQDLEARRPAFVLVRSPATQTGISNEQRPWLESNYRKTLSIDDYALYELRDPEPQTDER